MALYIHHSPIHKSMHKNKINHLVRLLNIIKRPSVPFLPNSPPQAQGSNPPHFLPFLTHERAMSTQ